MHFPILAPLSLLLLALLTTQTTALRPPALLVPRTGTGPPGLSVSFIQGMNEPQLKRLKDDLLAIVDLDPPSAAHRPLRYRRNFRQLERVFGCIDAAVAEFSAPRYAPGASISDGAAAAIYDELLNYRALVDTLESKTSAIVAMRSFFDELAGDPDMGSGI